AAVARSTTSAEGQQQTAAYCNEGSGDVVLEDVDVIDRTPFLDDVALQTHTGVHGGTCEQNNHGGQQGHREQVGKPPACSQQITTTGDEGGCATAAERGIQGVPCFRAGGIQCATDCYDGNQCQRTFTESTEVANETGIGFLVQLLGAGTGRHDAVEAGEC